MRTFLLTIFFLPVFLLAEMVTFKPVIREEDAVTYLDLHVEVAPGAHIYADSFELHLPDGIDASLAQPLPTQLDKDTESQVLQGSLTISYILSPPVPKGAFDLSINWQGCSDEVCLLPQTTVLTVNGAGGTQAASPSEHMDATPSDALQGFKVAAVDLLEGGTHAGDLLDTVHHVGVGVREIVDDYYFVACLLQLYGGVAADETGATGDENGVFHIV